VLAECAYPAIDVSLPHWTELPAPQASPAQPLLADNVCWLEDDFVRATPNGRAARLTTFERILRKARTSLDRMARHPAVVGYAWSRWQDDPGEQPPFAGGLVHVNGAEAREHTEVLMPVNFRAETLRRESSG
jgi:hypothetical protein